jgi:hypothetical protein
MSYPELTLSGDELATYCDDLAATGIRARADYVFYDDSEPEEAYEDLSPESKRRYDYLILRGDALKARLDGRIAEASRLEDNAERLVDLILEGDGLD